VRNRYGKHRSWPVRWCLSDSDANSGLARDNMAASEARASRQLVSFDQTSAGLPILWEVGMQEVSEHRFEFTLSDLPQAEFVKLSDALHLALYGGVLSIRYEGSIPSSAIEEGMLSIVHTMQRRPIHSRAERWQACRGRNHVCVKQSTQRHLPPHTGTRLALRSRHWGWSRSTAARIACSSRYDSGSPAIRKSTRIYNATINCRDADPSTSRRRHSRSSLSL